MTRVSENIENNEESYKIVLEDSNFKQKEKRNKETTQVSAAVCICTTLTATAAADPPHS